MNDLLIFLRMFDFYKSKIDFFPTSYLDTNLIDMDIPDVHKLEEESVDTFKVCDDDHENVVTEKKVCTVCGTTESTAAVQSELQRFLKLQDVGLDTSLPKCMIFDLDGLYDKHHSKP